MTFTHGFGDRNGNTLQYFLPEKSHGQRCLVGCSPWGHEELDTTEWLSMRAPMDWSFRDNNCEYLIYLPENFLLHIYVQKLNPMYVQFYILLFNPWFTLNSTSWYCDYHLMLLSGLHKILWQLHSILGRCSTIYFSPIFWTLPAFKNSTSCCSE